MPISHSQSLFQLIKSLTKAEKRNFKLYAKRNHSGDSLKFIDLFDIMDKQSEVDETSIFKKLKGLSKPQYANLKRHLYSQIIVSLRVIHKAKMPTIQARELVDFAVILYGKGLYLQSLKMLKIAKREATKHHLNYLQLTILEFEKLIETRHITRSGQDNATDLVKQTNILRDTISDTIYLSNLRMELHTKYLRNGHIRNQQDKEELRNYFVKKIERVEEKTLGVVERVFLFQSYVWYAYIQLDFKTCLQYAIKWVNHCAENPDLTKRDIDLHLRGYHYVLTAAMHLRDSKNLEKYLSEFEDFRYGNYKKFNENSRIISFLYVHSGRLNQVVIDGDFEKGLTHIPRTTKRIKKYKTKLDDHRVLVFYFKIAWIYFGANKISKSIFYLNKIVNKDMLNLREDLQYYARLMFLMCHYELQDFESMTYALKSFRPFFERTKDHNPAQISTLNLFKALAKAPPFDHKEIMKDYLAELELLKEDPLQQLSISYLDVISWLKARISRRSLSEVLRS
ncbi:MAG: hypothetical protein ACI9XB_000974 [Gammaproteobacteria bacterium]|jgi:hypothetical protein